MWIQFTDSCEMLAQFFAVIGLSWDLDQKRNDTELILSDQTGLWTKKLNKWWWNLQNTIIRYFVFPVPLRERTKKQRRLKKVYSLQRERSEHRVASSNGDLCESAQYSLSSSRFMRRVIRQLQSFGEVYKVPDYLDKTEIPTAPSSSADGVVTDLQVTQVRGPGVAGGLLDENFSGLWQVVVVEEVGVITCERGVVDQRAWHRPT